MKIQLLIISLLMLDYANIDAMKEPSYYKILGIEKTALLVDVKKAFRVKALLYHPDKNKEAGAEELFKQVNEAHQILSDEQARSNYDINLEYKKPLHSKEAEILRRSNNDISQQMLHNMIGVVVTGISLGIIIGISKTS